MTKPHKNCTKCGEVKPLEEFHRYKASPDGRKPRCKVCNCAEALKYQENNRDEVLEKSALYRENNRDKLREYQRDFHERNKEMRNAKTLEWHYANRDYVLHRQKQYRQENLERMRDSDRQYYENNRDIISEKSLRYREENRDFLIWKAKKSYHDKQEITKKLAAVSLVTHWIPGEDALLLSDNGMTVYQKAIELGRTYSSCNKRLEKLRRES